jgi:hypothetical protein
MNPSERGPLTVWEAETEGQVRTRNESEPARGTHHLESADEGTSQDTESIQRARGTHSLESADGGTSQDAEIIQASEGHSPTVERRRRDKSGH